MHGETVKLKSNSRYSFLLIILQNSCLKARLYVAFREGDIQYASGILEANGRIIGENMEGVFWILPRAVPQSPITPRLGKVEKTSRVS
jgi:hypothetical protein